MTTPASSPTTVQDLSTPIFPPEILANVFNLVITPTRGHHGRLVPDYGTPIWTKLIYLCLVCKGWRSTALDNHSLWRYVYYPRVEFFRRILERSKPFPVVLAVNRLSHLHPAVFEEGNAGRVEELTISFSKRFFDVNQDSNDPASYDIALMPNVTSIIFTAHNEYETDFEEEEEDDYTDEMAQPTSIIGLLLARSTTLRHLEIRECDLPEPGSSNYDVMNSVETLTFRYQERQPAINMEKVQELLLAVPRLQHLDINGFPDSQMGQGTSIYEDIPLIHLTSIELCLSVGDCRELFRVINVPNIQSQHYDLQFFPSQHGYSEDHSMASLSELLDAWKITSTVAEEDRPSFSHAAIGLENQRQVDLQMWNSDATIPSSAGLSSSSRCLFTLIADDGDSDEGPISSFVVLENLALRDSPQDACITVSSRKHIVRTRNWHREEVDDDLAPFFSRSSHIRRLQLKDCNQLPLGLMSEDYETRPLVKLESLSLLNSVFKHRDQRGMMEQIVELVKFRSGHKLPFKKIELVQCKNLTQDLVDVLRGKIREYGVEVEWDGVKEEESLRQ